MAAHPEKISGVLEAVRKKTLVYSDAIILCKRDQEAIAEAIGKPASPGPQLVAAYEKYKDHIGK